MPSIATLFAAILGDISATLFHHMGDNRARVPVLMLVSNYLARTADRLARLYARFQAGTLPAPRPARATSAPSAAPRPPRAPSPRCPRQRAWLLRQDRRLAAQSSQLRHLLAQPDFAAFLRAAPPAGRLIRPILHLLSPDPPPAPLALPPCPRKPRPPRPKPAPEPPHLRPLQPYVRAAARAWREKPA